MPNQKFGVSLFQHVPVAVEVHVPCLVVAGARVAVFVPPPMVRTVKLVSLL